MTQLRWEPLNEFLSLSDKMNRMFHHPSMHIFTPVEPVSGWLPAVDIHEETDRFVMQAEVPGVRSEDIDVSVENNTITLRGEKKQEKVVDGENACRLERFYGTFTRSFVLSTRINPEQIKATFKDGVLEVIVPKAEEVKPKKIKILATGDGK
jgi:HSP20 family protein